ncbi:MAG: ferredoxin FdxA [Methylophagaceae bacterium]|jgi:ferredoxin|tara:strand:+ start:734 stop:1087 length:354 start_codon:yes stop_codon:yes gene_type:complete
MTYLVTEECINCKHMTCVSVCPVDCFYEGANMLVINPDECIDCGVCVPECPVDAIIGDNEPGWDPNRIEAITIHNQKMSDMWPNITEARDPPEDHEEWFGVKDKMEKYGSEEPGLGD